MLTATPPVIGDALFARSIPAHVCAHIPLTRDELDVDGTVAHYAPPFGVFYVRGRRVVAVYVRSTRELCNVSRRPIVASWTL